MAKIQRLGDLLIGAGIITEEELQKGLELQKQSKDRLGKVLIDNGIISEQEMIEALQMQLGIEFVDLTKVSIPTELAQTVPKNIARQYQVVPIKVVKDELYLAMSDPMNFYALEDVRKTVGKRIIPVIATAAAVDHAIAVLYGNEGAAKAIEEMKREAGISNDYAQTTAASQSFTFSQEDSKANAPTIRLVNSILERAISERSSDIHLGPREMELTVRMRIDGVMYDIMSVPKDLQNSVTSRIKIMSGLDISEHRVPQDGRFNVRVKEKNLDVRVSTLPTVYGEKIVMRLLDKSAGLLTKESIGLSGSDLEKYEKMIRCHNGVILIVGPTGSGKSSTMNTMVQELNTTDVNLITLEDPVEYNIDRVSQVQINEKTGMTFANGLRSILRQDPDIIAVGEIRDGETADIAMRAAITGHVVLSTIHTNDAISTIDRLLDVGVEPYLISSALKGVVSQRLVRRICPECKQAYTPTEEELDEIQFHQSKWADHKPLIFYKGKGCSNCQDTGYRGRTAVFEMLPITKEIRKCISKNLGREAIEEVVEAPGSDFVSLQENAIRLVLEGVTTASEVLRVVAEAD